MRDYGKVHATFWTSPTTSGLSDDGKMLALYLLTCSHSTITGVFRLPDGYVAEDLGWSSERVAEGFAELFAKGFANRCGTTKWAWIRQHLKWNRPENPNQRKAAAKIALQIPDECSWKLDFMRVCGPSLGLEPPEDPNPSGTLPEPLLNQKQEQKQEQDIEPGPETVPGPPPASLRLEPEEPEPPPVIELPLVTGMLHPVIQAQVDEWRDSFPAVDVLAELKRMRTWLNANPKERKTAAGINRFIVRWLSRQQDEPRRNGRPQQQADEPIGRFV